MLIISLHGTSTNKLKHRDNTNVSNNSVLALKSSSSSPLVPPQKLANIFYIRTESITLPSLLPIIIEFVKILNINQDSNYQFELPDFELSKGKERLQM